MDQPQQPAAARRVVSVERSRLVRLASGVVHQWKWTTNDVGAVTNGWSDGDAGALLTWAVWTCHSLDYLKRLDDHAFGSQPRVLHEGPPDIVDLAHVRWASGSAVTALDLCAATLGRLYAGGASAKELALVDLSSKSKLAPTLRHTIPAPGIAWVDAALADADYVMLKRTRNPMTHSRIVRTLQAGTVSPGPHGQRTLLPVGPNGALVDAREVVVTADRFAFRNVESFLDGVMRGDY